MSAVAYFESIGLIQPPPEIAALRQPWERLSGRLPHLATELEDEFRFGHVVTSVGNGYRLGGSIKGGSSSVWAPVGEEVYNTYRAWEAIEGMSRDAPWHAAEVFYRLKHRLASVGIEISSRPDEYTAHHGGAYRLLEAILSLLPDEHLAWLLIEVIQLGGWGPDAAKASAYKDGKVYLYDFILSGARRTFAGVALHEIGHAFFAALRPEKKAMLEDAHRVIAAGGALFGTEFLLDAESRIVYQEFLLDEFAAETYMLYVAQGSRLRDFIARRSRTAAEAWANAYRLYLEAFAGWAYI